MSVIREQKLADNQSDPQFCCYSLLLFPVVSVDDASLSSVTPLKTLVPCWYQRSKIPEQNRFHNPFPVGVEWMLLMHLNL